MKLKKKKKKKTKKKKKKKTGNKKLQKRLKLIIFFNLVNIVWIKYLDFFFLLLLHK